MPVGGWQQTHQQSRLLKAQIGSGAPKVNLCRIFKTPAHAEIDPVQIAEQQLTFAETALQLKRDEQFPPFAPKGVALADEIRVKTARQLLRQAAAALFQLATAEVGDECAQRANRVHTRMPPEPVVFTTQQSIDQGGREAPEGRQFAVATGVDRMQRNVVAVVYRNRSLHRRQASPHRHGHGRQQQQQATSPHTCDHHRGQAPFQASAPAFGWVLKLQHWSIAVCFRR